MQNIPWDYIKIVATIGPASDSEEKLQAIIQAGMNVARLNTKHSTPEWHAERIQRIRNVSEQISRNTAILVDLQGPEIRITLTDDTPIELEEGEALTMSGEQGDAQVFIPQNVVESLDVGDYISIDDGICEFSITDKDTSSLTCTALNDCVVGQRKTLNTPGKVIDLPALIEADYAILDILKENPADFVALSFVRNAEDVTQLRHELEQRGLSETAIVAKIENQSAIDHLDEIIESADAVMVARGDLAVEIPIEQLAARQKEIIDHCRRYGKPVITATQMLKSMVDNRRPTRAEVSDVANAIFDGTDAIMLSEETTIGKYPIETVKMMRKIARYNEKLLKAPSTPATNTSRTTAVTQMAAHLIQDDITAVDQVVVLTETGFTVQQLARHRVLTPILAVTNSIHTVHQASLSFGVKALHIDFPETGSQFDSEILKMLLKQGIINSEEQLMLIHGDINKKPGFTNTVSLIDTKELR